MDILRRNTDYALRAMIHLAGHYGDDSVSTRQIAKREEISYQLVCKLLQRLHKENLVKSSMGPKGGFQLSMKPSKINLLKVIKAIQGRLSLNKCLLDAEFCQRQPECPVNKKLCELQKYIEKFLSNITLADLVNGNNTKRKTSAIIPKRKKI